MLREAEHPRAWLEVDLDAIVRNARAVAERAGVPLLPMVKADAYGLGAVPVVHALEQAAPWGYGVATVDEGATLRAAGVSRPIVVFNPLLEAEIPVAQRECLSPTLSEAVTIARWAAATGNAAWHLAIDTGMSRSGIRWSSIGNLAPVLAQHPPFGVCTHFHSADADDGSAQVQLGRFREALAALPMRPQMLHAENSPAIERLSDRSAWTVVRPGVFLYGVGSRAEGHAGDPASSLSPASDAPTPRLRCVPVVTLRARIVDLRQIEPGESVSYGATFRPRDRRRIATVAAGYADGYRRAFSNVGHALLHGHRVPVAGIVTMDMTMLDVTGVDCEIGDVVTLLGTDVSPRHGPGSRAGADAPPSPSIDLAEAARAAGLCTYELLTGLRLRAPRVYLACAPR